MTRLEKRMELRRRVLLRFYLILVRWRKVCNMCWCMILLGFLMSRRKILIALVWRLSVFWIRWRGRWMLWIRRLLITFRLLLRRRFWLRWLLRCRFFPSCFSVFQPTSSKQSTQTFPRPSDPPPTTRFSPQSLSSPWKRTLSRRRVLMRLGRQMPQNWTIIRGWRRVISTATTWWKIWLIIYGNSGKNAGCRSAFRRLKMRKCTWSMGVVRSRETSMWKSMWRKAIRSLWRTTFTSGLSFRVKRN